MNKINSYIGFAKKSRTILFGEDKILEGKNIKLVVCSNTISNNFLKKIEKANLRTICLVEQEFNKLQIDAKVFAITNENLAQAIEKELTNIGGNNFDNKQ